MAHVSHHMGQYRVASHAGRGRRGPQPAPLRRLEEEEQPPFHFTQVLSAQADPSTAFAGAGDPTVLLLAGSGVRTEPHHFVATDGLRQEGLLAVSLPLPSQETQGGFPAIAAYLTLQKEFLRRAWPCLSRDISHEIHGHLHTSTH